MPVGGELPEGPFSGIKSKRDKSNSSSITGALHGTNKSVEGFNKQRLKENHHQLVATLKLDLKSYTPVTTEIFRRSGALNLHIHREQRLRERKELCADISKRIKSGRSFYTRNASLSILSADIRGTSPFLLLCWPRSLSRSGV